MNNIEQVQSYMGNVTIGDYVLYLSNIKHLGHYKKNIWKIIEASNGNDAKIENIVTGDKFTTIKSKLVNINVINKYGFFNTKCIGSVSYTKYSETIDSRSNPCSEIYLSSTELCSRQ